MTDSAEQPLLGEKTDTFNEVWWTAIVSLTSDTMNYTHRSFF